MATTTTTEPLRTLNDKLTELTRKTANAYLDTFDLVVKAQTEFVTELVSTSVAAGRQAQK